MYGGIIITHDCRLHRYIIYGLFICAIDKNTSNSFLHKYLADYCKVEENLDHRLHHTDEGAIRHHTQFFFDKDDKMLGRLVKHPPQQNLPRDAATQELAENGTHYFHCHCILAISICIQKGEATSGVRLHLDLLEDYVEC